MIHKMFKDSGNLYQGLFASLLAGIGGVFGFLIDPKIAVPILCTIIMGVFGLFGILLKHWLEHRSNKGKK